MGIYHLMGLGKSVGAVTAAISYMAVCRQTTGGLAEWLFGKSGEPNQPLTERGDMHALVLFTTPELYDGREACSDYCDNRAGSNSKTPRNGEPMQRALKRVMLPDLPALVAPDHRYLDLYWCDIVRDNPVETFKRVARVLASAKPVGKIGKEIWVNLTGGNNLLNSALQLAAALLGTPARMYYLLADDPKFARHTRAPHIGDGFWIDVPLVFLEFDRAHRALLNGLADPNTSLVKRESLYSRLIGLPEFSAIAASDNSAKVFDLGLVLPLIRHGLLAEQSDGTITLGTHWSLFRQYLDAIPPIGEPVPSFTELTRDEKTKTWFRHEKIQF